MSVYFLDSSALIKRYAAEAGTAWVQSLFAPGAGNRIMIAQITPVEIISGLCRKQREARISVRTLQAAGLLLDRHVRREYGVIRFVDAIEQQSKALLMAYPLRAYDAVQLASVIVSARQLRTAGVGTLTFISADTRLLSAAMSEGLLTDNPANHP